MKILSLVFNRNTFLQSKKDISDDFVVGNTKCKNPTILERLEVIDNLLSQNNDTDILVCSEAFLARINNENNNFVAIDEYKKNLASFLEEPEKKESCEQQKIINSNDCESEETLLLKLKEISLKYPRTLIVPGTTFVKNFNSNFKRNIDNRTYLILNGSIIKNHNKIKIFAGFQDDFDVDSLKYDKKGSYPTDVTFEHKDYNVIISICADVSSIKTEKTDKLSIFLSLTYGLSPPTLSEINRITNNIDIYIQPDGLALQTYLVKNPSFLGDFTIIEKSLDKFENIIKYSEINITQTIEQRAEQKRLQQAKLAELAELAKLAKSAENGGIYRINREKLIATELMEKELTKSDNFRLKYLKYKTKYIKLKNKNI
jgi:predicted amidohydrolase